MVYQEPLHTMIQTQTPTKNTSDLLFLTGQSHDCLALFPETNKIPVSMKKENIKWETKQEKHSDRNEVWWHHANEIYHESGFMDSALESVESFMHADNVLCTYHCANNKYPDK